MDALINAQPHQGGEPIDSPLRSGLTSHANPEAQSVATGVSVGNTHSATGETSTPKITPPQFGRKWFVLRVSYGRSIKAEQLLKELGITTYNPLHVVVKMVRGRRRRVQLPLLPGLLFVHAEPTFLDATIKEPAVRALLSYYYDHFQQTALGNNPPLTVSDSSMQSFIIATTHPDQDVRVVNPEQVHYKSGDIVRVIAGDFKGVEGRVARTAGQQRVIVQLQGLCLIATAYIPTGCLEIITPAAGKD